MILMIKAVIFDFGGVLLKYKSMPKYEYLGKIVGITKEKAKEKVHEIITPFQKGKVSSKEFWEMLEEKLGKLPEDLYEKWWFIGLDACFDEEVIKIARTLKEKGYKLALLTNTIQPYYKFHAKSKDYEVVDFDVKVISCVDGVRKPEKEAYLLTLERLGVKPYEAVYVDDIKDYVEAAGKLGIHTILFENSKQLRKEFLKYGIKV